MTEVAIEIPHSDDKVICPSCHQSVPNRPDIKQGVAHSELLDRPIGVISIGFKCLLCGHVWGHELPADWVEAKT